MSKFGCRGLAKTSSARASRLSWWATPTAGGVAAVVLAASLGGCLKSEPPVDAGKIAAAVKADARQLVAEFNAHDATKAAAHDAPNFIGMAHGAANVVGPDADLAATKQQVADPNVKITVNDETVDVAAAGDMAIYRATYLFTFTDPQTKIPKTEIGNWLVGYKAQSDGTWKIVWDVVSDTPAPAAPKTA